MKTTVLVFCTARDEQKNEVHESLVKGIELSFIPHPGIILTFSAAECDEFPDEVEMHLTLEENGASYKVEDEELVLVFYRAFAMFQDFKEFHEKLILCYGFRNTVGNRYITSR